eukprot:TRINITY_DN19027_c0_g1_i2.p1 TRINITY_DN19027_c0_g1~~TRINITY_DN19027_c0_g1_i2.p1  ORF type:complete len:367 (+),score=81.53 TRINITY_DN19027_c0_g1_i2:98-1102(+)
MQLSCRALGGADADVEAAGGRRVGVFVDVNVYAGDIIERCYALAVPVWQAHEDFVWSCGAFAACDHMESQDGCAEAGAEGLKAGGRAFLPLGWGMLYADATRVGLPHNVIWSGEEAYGSSAPLVVLRAARDIMAGEELVLESRRLPVSVAAGDLDVASFAASLLDDRERRSLAASSADEADDAGAIIAEFLNVERGDEVVVTHPSLALRVGRSSRHGLGVFAQRAFRAGDVLELAPCVVVEEAEVPNYGGNLARYSHILSDYIFEEGALCVLPLGYGAIYNHSSAANIEQRWACSGSTRGRAGAAEGPLGLCYVFVALRDVGAAGRDDGGGGGR